MLVIGARAADVKTCHKLLQTVLRKAVKLIKLRMMDINAYYKNNKTACNEAVNHL